MDGVEGVIEREVAGDEGGGSGGEEGLMALLDVDRGGMDGADEAGPVGTPMEDLAGGEGEGEIELRGGDGVQGQRMK